MHERVNVGHSYRIVTTCVLDGFRFVIETDFFPNHLSKPAFYTVG